MVVRQLLSFIYIKRMVLFDCIKLSNIILHKTVRGNKAQLVTCLTADSFVIADSGVANSIPARSHTFVEIYHEIISAAILLPFAVSSRVVVS